MNKGRMLSNRLHLPSLYCFVKIELYYIVLFVCKLNLLVKMDQGHDLRLVRYFPIRHWRLLVS